MKLFFLCALSAVATSKADLTKLLTFDNAPETSSFRVETTNDPVMGGSSTSSFHVENKLGVFNGTCAIVGFLKAPGFANIIARPKSRYAHFKDVSAHIAGGVELRVRSTTSSYTGFKVAFAAVGVPRTSIYGGGSFKASFALADTTDFQTVFVPFSNFSYDWSGYTGRCDTKDPSGQQHHCCGEDGDKYCPKAGYLSKITDVEVWAEGVQGDFHIEVDYIGASDAPPAPPAPAPAGTTCKATEYCCPDAKKCLTPTTTSCKDDATVCGTGEVCCPLTKICVKPGADCSTPCADGGTYCCPDAKACLKPTNPGVFCTSAADCGSKSGLVCCPLTKLCVLPGDKCSPP